MQLLRETNWTPLTLPPFRTQSWVPLLLNPTDTGYSPPLGIGLPIMVNCDGFCGLMENNATVFEPACIASVMNRDRHNPSLKLTFTVASKLPEIATALCENKGSLAGDFWMPWPPTPPAETTPWYVYTRCFNNMYVDDWTTHYQLPVRRNVWDENVISRRLIGNDYVIINDKPFN